MPGINVFSIWRYQGAGLCVTGVCCMYSLYNCWIKFPWTPQTFVVLEIWDQIHRLILWLKHSSVTNGINLYMLLFIPLRTYSWLVIQRLLLVTYHHVQVMLSEDVETASFSFRVLNVSTSPWGSTLTTQVNPANLINISRMMFVLEQTCCLVF